MSSFTVGASTSNYTLSYFTNDALALAQQIAQAITTGETGGTLTGVPYVAGITAPAPPSGTGVADFSGTTAIAAVGIPAADTYVVDGQFNAVAQGPLSLQGSATGAALNFVGGAGVAGAPLNVALTTFFAASGTDSIAVLGGNNYIQTATTGGGNVLIDTGSGNDTINVLTGTGTVNPGSGSNTVNLGNGVGGVYIYSEGADTITGAASGAAADTVNIGAGNTSINSGVTNFLIQDNQSTNPLLVTLGFGTDTISMTTGASASIVGINSTTTFKGVGQIIAGDTGSGDFVSVSGAGTATLAAKAGNNTFAAGSGNDTLTAGIGSDTLSGAVGSGATALLVSGVAGATTFKFTNGASGGADTISGFKSTDLIQFSGYGSNPQGGAVTSGSVTTLTLSDGTKLTINGAVPGSSNFKAS